MYNELATNGLSELFLQGLADTEQLGGSEEKVKQACNRLNELADEMKGFVRRLEEKKNDILDNWEGEAATAFEEQLSNLLTVFSKVEGVIREHADWANCTMKGYTEVDESSARMMK